MSDQRVRLRFCSTQKFREEPWGLSHQRFYRVFSGPFKGDKKKTIIRAELGDACLLKHNRFLEVREEARGNRHSTISMFCTGEDRFAETGGSS